MGFQTNIVLSQSAADWLDTQALAIRKGQHAYISRSAFVRALVHGIEDGGLDFSHCRSEAVIAIYVSIVSRAFLHLPLEPELPMYTTERLGTKGGCVQPNRAPAATPTTRISREKR